IGRSGQPPPCDHTLKIQLARKLGLESVLVTSADSPLTELVETVAPALRVVRWYAAEIVVGLAVVVTALAALALAGAAIDDAAINAERGTATAEVLDSSFSRTLIRFPTAN